MRLPSTSLKMSVKRCSEGSLRVDHQKYSNLSLNLINKSFGFVGLIGLGVVQIFFFLKKWVKS